MITPPTKYNHKVAKYYGSDIAKTMTTIQNLTQLRSLNDMLTLLIEYIHFRTGSVITSPGFGTYVYLYDIVTHRLIHTFSDYRLDEYHERVTVNDNIQYITKFDNILVMMTKSYKKEIDINKEINIMRSISEIN